MPRTIAALALLALLGACTVQTKSPKVEIEPGKVTIEAGGPEGDFCPPGQAKKGRC